MNKITSVMRVVKSSIPSSRVKILTPNMTIVTNVKLVQISYALLQYSQRHSLINHCDRRITLLSNTDISFGLFNLFTYSVLHCWL
jgi:hypothetical protein